MKQTPFSELQLSSAQLSNLDSLEYKWMTPIQAAALPGALAGEDLIGQAKTGSGKTAVFALSILAQLDVSSRDTQAVVLCPTRELSIQVSAEIRRLARHLQNTTLATLYGGQAFDLQKKSMQTGAHIVVGTPGRIKDHLEKGTVTMKTVRTVVLDEADRMLDMGFHEDIDAILRRIPRKRQTLLFSATFPENIQELSSRYQRTPRRVTVAEEHHAKTIKQSFFRCEIEDRLDGLKRLLLAYEPASTVVFCNYKKTTVEVCAYLKRSGFSALALNGDLEQREREEVLTQFKQRSCLILVATDVAARGLDIKDLRAVINYELSPDPEVHVHRIGRTGRAGGSGIALSLSGDRDGPKLEKIGEYQGSRFQAKGLPTFVGGAKIPKPPYVTLAILGGRKAKIRAGEILGTLTAEGGVEGKQVGKIDVMDFASYVAVAREVAAQAEKKLRTSKIKGRSFRIHRLG